MPVPRRGGNFIGTLMRLGAQRLGRRQPGHGGFFVDASDGVFDPLGDVVAGGEVGFGVVRTCGLMDLTTFDEPFRFCGTHAELDS